MYSISVVNMRCILYVFEERPGAKTCPKYSGAGSGKFVCQQAIIRVIHWSSLQGLFGLMTTRGYNELWCFDKGLPSPVTQATTRSAGGSLVGTGGGRLVDGGEKSVTS